ncbi:MAG TPA: hypothetical protein VEV15_07475, partial [Flavisolibacter sp.]|nr:hypothetical protein [Flavisolibacter sp.]
KTFSTDAKEANAKMDIAKGMNQFVWNLLYPASERIEGMILWNGVPGGIVAAPGNYFARFKAGQDSVDVPFTLKADPNYKTTQAEYEQQFAFLKTVQDKFNETQKAIKDIRALRTQINSFIDLQGKEAPKEVKTMADSINKQLTAIEETLYQTKAKSGQDVLNYPIRLNDKLSGVFDVANSGNFAPSRQSKEVYADIAAQIDAQLNKLKAITQKDIPAFNELIRQKSLPVIGVK